MSIHPKAGVVSIFESSGSAPPRKALTLGELIRRPEMTPELAADVDDLMEGKFRRMWNDLGQEARRFVMAEVKYKDYFEREARQVAVIRQADRVRIPDNFSYSQVNNLTAEVRQRLDEIRPETLGQAGRISGVTPAAVAVLEIHLRKARPSDGNGKARRKTS